MSDEPEDRDLLAAEYVLGVLDAQAMQIVARQAENDQEVASAVAAWQDRLAPLAALIPPVPPPDGLWQRIQATIGRERTARVAMPRPRQGGLAWVWRDVAFWRAAAAGGFAVAAALAGIIVSRPVVPHAVAALVPAGGAAAVYVVEARGPGHLILRAVMPVTVSANRSLELWSLPPGATRPVSLGVLPAKGRQVDAPDLPPATQLLVSLEPEGGSPTGQPTGPVQYAGTLGPS